MKILHIVSNISIRNGVMSVLMNYYRNISADNVKFAFLYYDEKEETYEKEILSLGGEIYKFKRKTFPCEWRKFCKENYGKFDILHNHELYLATFFTKSKKKLGNKAVISHAHVTKFSDSTLKSVRNKILSLPSREADYLLACSKDAGNCLFGNHYKINGYVLKNAIDTEKYKYDDKIRAEIRKEYEIQEGLVVGHVGNFSPQKNHLFMLDIFNELLKRELNATLMLVGDGYLREKIKEKAEEFGIGDKVIFVGATDRVNEFLCAMDVYVFPSLFEGLGIALVEAQANGLACIYSDVIPKEADIKRNRNICMSLDDAPTLWAQSILKVDKTRVSMEHEVKKSGYDISNEAMRLVRFYEDIFEGKRSTALRRGE